MRALSPLFGHVQKWLAVNERSCHEVRAVSRPSTTWHGLSGLPCPWPLSATGRPCPALPRHPAIRYEHAVSGLAGRVSHYQYISPALSVFRDCASSGGLTCVPVAVSVKIGSCHPCHACHRIPCSCGPKTLVMRLQAATLVSRPTAGLSGPATPGPCILTIRPGPSAV